MAIMVIIVLSLARCQENERRAVAEHQFMHDRGQAVQSLKRLMWLSNTIEGLHTAQARTLQLEPDPTECGHEGPQQCLSQQEREVRHSTLASLLQILCDVHKPHLTRLPESKK
ncbi:hypothetical protein COCON_G00178290 [Conger conger]|uniref:Uncharacterized protein n=2 Tax=Conger conger TaxID=82655 RepID=A0A9Q1D5U8_CONCO|nr:hypothetical protein COCON_G00178290 [Conger conger]